MANPSRPNYHFFGLLLITLSIGGAGFAITWSQGQTWLQLLWDVCQQQWHALSEYVPLLWQMIIPLLLLAMLVRGLISAWQQLRATAQLATMFYPLRQMPPARLAKLMRQQRIPMGRLVYLAVPTPHAFCVGFFKPRIWLTEGLINLLSDQELASVLAHEAHHCRYFDPLKLLIGRTLGAAFFFLPLVNDLAESAELQQEVAADQAAIAHLGDDLPLLSALHKLLRSLRSKQPNVSPQAVLSQLNITEARLKRLIYPPKPSHWRETLAPWAINAGIICLLVAIALFSAQSAQATSAEAYTCTPDDLSPSTQQSQAWLSYYR